MLVKARGIVVVGLLAVAACGRDDAEEVRRARYAAEQQALSDGLDHLEDRLVVNQARVRFWREMRERHESVSAVACATLDGHAEEMARLLEQEPPVRSAARRGSRVARLSEPGPCANISGTAPIRVATVVITIARNRMRTPSTTA